MNQSFVKITPRGTFYYKDKEMKILHNENGPSCEYINGDKVWYKNGKLHNENGPSVIQSNGLTVWFKDGMLHNENGPTRVDGYGVEEYWLNNRKYTKNIWLKIISKPYGNQKHLVKKQKKQK